MTLKLSWDNMAQRLAAANQREAAGGAASELYQCKRQMEEEQRQHDMALRIAQYESQAVHDACLEEISRRVETIEQSEVTIARLRRLISEQQDQIARLKEALDRASQEQRISSLQLSNFPQNLVAGQPPPTPDAESLPLPYGADAGAYEESQTVESRPSAQRPSEVFGTQTTPNDNDGTEDYADGVLFDDGLIPSESCEANSHPTHN
ncbi:hypothetical protein CC85DRAFT_185397 [Cutaneotrichosporon oleaginosum]|uniref:Uncharacterized protein n=1 Tax=Cutaneotrichosporon oleaginosum TaxID=879819 RepID=A0A0J0XEU6_9TREE|nr:uncharacterized protein CC85DRAFT_185397 [Cutaneotrichosporon oleaginosum]KLT39602.1 hypothetical protein CC85DRAFT_185397 [Cutaneotrichosporon oleaginosum]TXT15470.1 hypothetical protein COLE_01663 [Cutaneotrichosporon oleaginosum]